MSLSAIRAGIKARLESVTGIGKVDDYVVWTDEWATLYSKFVDNAGRINHWMIGLSGTPSPPEISGQSKNIFWQFRILAIYSLKTANESSKEFENLIEAVILKFTERTSVAQHSTITTPITVLGIENKLWTDANIPIHAAQLQLTIREAVDQALGCG